MDTAKVAEIKRVKLRILAHGNKMFMMTTITDAIVVMIA